MAGHGDWALEKCVLGKVGKHPNEVNSLRKARNSRRGQ